MEQLATKPIPFLRWAGGKKWLVRNFELGKIIFKKYHEPFLGGGAFFFALQHNNKAYLSDVNDELIQTYLAVKNSPYEILKILSGYSNNEKFYYSLRLSNPTSNVEKAAKFIYLNQTSYNGLYRVNKLGKYNVPYGFRKTVNVSSEKILAASNALKKANLSVGDFYTSLDLIGEGDLVFLDPPYTVSHNNNGFVKYNKTLFSLDDQIRLSEFIDKVKEKNAYYILTNAAHKSIYEIFNKGDRLIEVQRNSLIGGSNSKRGLISEYIFTNIKEEML